MSYDNYPKISISSREFFIENFSRNIISYFLWNCNRKEINWLMLHYILHIVTNFKTKINQFVSFQSILNKLDKKLINIELKFPCVS